MLVQALIMSLSLVVFMVFLESEEPSAWQRVLATLLPQSRHGLRDSAMFAVLLRSLRFRAVLEEFLPLCSS